jgi:hypothetical protein
VDGGSRIIQKIAEYFFLDLPALDLLRAKTNNMGIIR